MFHLVDRSSNLPSSVIPWWNLRFRLAFGVVPQTSRLTFWPFLKSHIPNARATHAAFHPRNSYQTMQNQNRAGGDGSGGDAGGSSPTVPTGSNAGVSPGTGERRSESGTPDPRPASIKARQGFSDVLVDVSQPVTPDKGSAFNLLGLPPSPATRAGITGASGGGTSGGGRAGGNLGGVGDVMAGQVRCRLGVGVVGA